MEKLKQLLKEIEWLSSTSSGVINDMAQEALRILDTKDFYTKEEIMQMLNRRDNIETES